MIGVHEKALTVSPFTQRHPGLTPSAGYAAARTLHAHRVSKGWKAMGRKVGGPRVITHADGTEELASEPLASNGEGGITADVESP